MKQTDRVRVAVVGSGMAGLVTAYLINRDGQSPYAVTLFEEASTLDIHSRSNTDSTKGDTLSLDAASLSVPNHQKCVDRIDLPMRAFAGGFYKNLIAMYDHLGVEYRAHSFLFNFSSVATQDTRSKSQGQWTSYYVHPSNSRCRPPARPEGTGVVIWLMETLYLLVCYTWFSACCFFVLPRTAGLTGVCETLDEYLHRIKLPQHFVALYLLPMWSSVATCSHEALLAFPAADVTEYMRTTYWEQHYTVTHGVQDVQRRLARGIDTRLSVTVTAVETQLSGVRITWRQTRDGHGATTHEDMFDKVILAVSPTVVGKIFTPLQYVMARIPTTSVESIVHTDTNTIRAPPVQQAADKPKRLHHKEAQTIHLQTSTEDTHRTESIHVHTSGVLVSTCPFSHIDADKVIKSARFTRVLRTPESRGITNEILSQSRAVLSISAEKKQRSMWTNGDGNVWLVGSWCWDGMVLLEGCVSSAMRVAEALDVQIPWHTRRRSV